MRIGLNVPQYDIDFAAGRCDGDVLAAYAAAGRDAGFDSLWLSDHPFARAPDGHICSGIDPVPAVASIATSLPDVEVGTLVLGLSLRSVPEVCSIARAWSRVAPGRITVGVGAGWNPHTHAALGVPLASYQERTGVLAAAARALADPAAGTRVLIGGWGEAVLETAARHGDVWNLAWDPGVEAFRSLSTRLDAACLRTGRDPATLARSVGVTVLAAAAESEARAAVAAVAARAPFLSGLALDTVRESAIVGDAAECALRIAEYEADEVVVSPFVRDSLDMVGELAACVAALR